MSMAKADEAVKHHQYSKAVELLHQDYEKLAATMEEKTAIETQKAVGTYKEAEDKMKGKLHAAIGKDLPKVLREVIGKALMSFQDSKITRGEVNEILQKHFSDKTFDNILLCVQGDLTKCEQIKLEDWKEKAEKHIASKAHIT